MTVENSLVESIVSRVIARLASPSAPVRADDVSPAIGSTATSKTDGLLLTDQVITADLLQQKVNGAKSLSVTTKSVLTPSARDYLKSHNIEWNRRSTETTASTNRVAWKAIVVRSTAAVNGLLDDANRATGAAWTRQLAGDAAEAADLAVSALCRAEAAGVVVFTNQPQVVACHANRNRQVRAAVAANSADVQSARNLLGANLLCVDAAGLGYFELRNVLRDLTAGGSPEAPAGWKD